MTKTHSGSVALVGLPNVGKSTLLNALVGQKIAATSPKAQTSRRKTVGIVTRENIQMLLADTPGMLLGGDLLQKFMQRQVSQALYEADVITLIIDASAKPRDIELGEKLLLQRQKKPQVIILTKIDKVRDKSSLLPLLTLLGQKFPGAEVIPVSAKKGEGLEQLISALARLMPPGEFCFDVDALTAETERGIVSEIIREKAMLFLGQEIPYQMAVRIDAFDESKREDSTKALVDISAHILVEKDRQKAIVIGAKGQKIKEIGTAARSEIEELLGCKVMLRLMVKADAHWMKTAQML